MSLLIRIPHFFQVSSSGLFGSLHIAKGYVWNSSHDIITIRIRWDWPTGKDFNWYSSTMIKNQPHLGCHWLNTSTRFPYFLLLFSFLWIAFKISHSLNINTWISSISTALTVKQCYVTFYDRWTRVCSVKSIVRFVQNVFMNNDQKKN